MHLVVARSHINPYIPDVVFRFVLAMVAVATFPRNTTAFIICSGVQGSYYHCGGYVNICKRK